ncbi:MAG: hypothetical protein JNN08_14380 [Bryobacterales bacterium]|nr:hypothetical protein [Bryobacterales bacterium]
MASTDLLIEDGVAERQLALIRLNVGWLRQALALLVTINDEVFSTTPEGLAPHRVSAHLRHIIEFYECFLDGLYRLRVDYDARRRDASIERSRQAAMARILWLISRLKTEPALMGDSILFVRAEDARSLGLRDPFSMSSVARELMTLSSHTIHHFALIAMALRAHGVPVEASFGVAPSTLSYHARLAAGAEVA